MSPKNYVKYKPEDFIVLEQPDTASFAGPQIDQPSTVPPENVYINSPHFQAILTDAKTNGLDSLTDEQRTQVKAAENNFPQINNYLRKQLAGAEKEVASVPFDISTLPQQLKNMGRAIENWVESPTEFKHKLGDPKFIPEIAEAAAKGLLKFPPEMATQLVKEIEIHGPVVGAIRFGAGLLRFPFQVGTDIANMFGARIPPVTEIGERAISEIQAPTAEEVIEQYKQDPTPIVLAALPFLKAIKPRLKFAADGEALTKRVESAERILDDAYNTIKLEIPKEDIIKPGEGRIPVGEKPKAPAKLVTEKPVVAPVKEKPIKVAPGLPKPEKMAEKPIKPKAEKAPVKVEVIKPTVELGAGVDIKRTIFPSKGEQFTRELKKRGVKLEGEAEKTGPSITMDLKIKDSQTAVQRPSHKYGAVPDEYGEIKSKYGLAAAEAQQKLMLTELEIRGNQGAGGQEIGEILNKASRKERKKYEQDIIDGLENPREFTEKRTDIPDNVKTVIKDLKTVAERQTKELIKLKREDIRPAIEQISEQNYRAENNLKGEKLTDKQRIEIKDKVDSEVKAQVPDDWGIKDYFRHLHLGDYRILRDGEFIAAAKTWSEALPKIADDYALNPTGKPNYAIKLREFTNPDVVRVSRARHYKLLNDIAKEIEAESPGLIADILRGKIGTKEGQRKWAPFTQKRREAPGYSRDLEFVLNYHNKQYHRWKGLYKLQGEIQPLIKKIRAEGRNMVADEIQTNLDVLWGKHRSKASQNLDNFLNTISGGRFRPFALERWAGRTRSALTTLMLKSSLKYNMMNSVQITQTGMVVPYKNIIWAQKAVRIAEGKGLLDKYNIYHMVTGAGGELTKIFTPTKVRAARITRTLRLSPETSNQAEMWLATYKHGRNLGMIEKAAAEYGMLRGMVYSQFLPLRTNIPRYLRPELVRLGPGMYRSFTIGTLELGSDLSKKAFGKGERKPGERIQNIGRLAHYVGAQLALGGTRVLTGPAAKLGAGGYLTYKLYNQIKDEYGETVANLVNWGLPSLINSDWSASIQLADMPYAESIPEAIGEIMLGPTGSIPLKVGLKTMANDGIEDSRLWRLLRATGQTFAGTRQLFGIEKVLRHDYNFKSPNGKLRFKGDLKDALVEAYGSRPIRSSVQSMWFDALTEVWSERNDVLNQAANVFYNTDDIEKAMDKTTIYNAKWPDAYISISDIVMRSMDKDKYENEEAFERALKQKGKLMRLMFDEKLKGK